MSENYSVSDNHPVSDNYQSITLYQTRLIVLIVLVMGIIFSSAQVWMEYFRFKDGMISTTEQVIESVKNAAAKAVYTLDQGLVTDIIEGVMAFEPIIALKITDETGAVLVERQSTEPQTVTWLDRLIPIGLIERTVALHDRYAPEQPIGTLSVIVSSARETKLFFDRALSIIISGILRSFIFALILLVVFHRFLSKPLLRMARDFSQVNVDNPVAGLLPDPNDYPNNEFRKVVSVGHRLLQKVGHNLSELKKSQEQLELRVNERTRELEVIQQRLLKAQRTARLGIWEWHLASDTLWWSEETYALFGVDPGSFTPTFETFLTFLSATDQELVRTAIRHSRSSKTLSNIEFDIVHDSGDTVSCAITGEVIVSDAGEVTSLLGTILDITERKAEKRALSIAKDEAERASRAKSAFLSSMSHELRTPMNAIIGFSQLLQMDPDEPLSPQQKENTDEILQAASHLLTLIDEVLDLAKVEANRIDLSIEPIQLSDLLSACLQIIQPARQARGISISLSWNAVPCAIEQLADQGVVVAADHTRLKQALLNLLSNAVKYNVNRGSIKIDCAQLDNGMTAISVTDKGPGLTEEQVAGLFTPFNRLGAEASGVEGTGIGLVITKRIVELMGGSVSGTSTLGVGSTFRIEIPSATENETGVKSKSRSELHVDNQVATDQQHRYTVVYIEDNPANLRLVAQVFKRRPHILLLSAAEPYLGLSLAKEKRPDLILLDINLPGLDGYAVLERLRQDNVTQDTPVVAVSAAAMPQDIKRGLAAGFMDYLTKPIDVAQLLRFIDEHLPA